ncbi:hypothetical protein BCR39DRAFT_549911 [Naematelia encephala]|uniref:Fe2OG dioxygenase domain-containing protein n=1 Tax=Naematelia encephala TaxID=71784 RepID=A0A1Y2ALG4_9TREE|nr:hypothetical protein BCR39DRAFT_549911 [Naematelia encephala]
MSLSAKEESYDIVDGKWVTFRAGGKPGRRLVRQPGEPGWVDTFDRIPIIDFTNVNHPDIEVRKKLAEELAEAAENVGFWYAANTPVSDQLIEETFSAMEKFFALPAEQKAKASWMKTPGARGYESFADVAQNEGSGKADATLRESFIMGDDITDPVQWQGAVPADIKPQNIWPPDMPEFKQALDAYYSVMAPFARSILRLFSLSLGLEETALDHTHEFPMNALRPLHYPPQEPDESAAGFLAHADFSTFTLVLQGKKYGSGLEVLNMNGHWIPAPALPQATFTCNVGDYLQHISDGRFVSTVHRVVNRSGQERYSLPFFFSPDPSAVLVPVVPAGQKRKTEPIPYEDDPIGDTYMRRLMFARRFHPTAKRIEELGLPQSEWKYNFLTGSLP